MAGNNIDRRIKRIEDDVREARRFQSLLMCGCVWLAIAATVAVVLLRG